VDLGVDCWVPHIHPRATNPRENVRENQPNPDGLP